MVADISEIAGNSEDCNPFGCHGVGGQHAQPLELRSARSAAFRYDCCA
jgi:hypothetical protein